MREVVGFVSVCVRLLACVHVRMSMCSSVHMPMEFKGQYRLSQSFCLTSFKMLSLTKPVVRLFSESGVYFFSEGL